VALAVLVALALSTQFLFQRSLYVEWSGRQIGVAWLQRFVTLVVIVATILLALLGAGRVRARRWPLRALLFIAALLAGACAGEWLALWLQWRAWPTAGFATILPRAVRWLPLGAISLAILTFRRRSNEIAAQLRAAEITRLQLDGERLAVQLQILQAQIEPHFLFNTLATIRRLSRTDPARGCDTLANFIRYLQSALPELHARDTTLGREADLITAYLDVLRVRMGSRLDFTVDVAPALRDCRIPPLSLATLVENAIKHGLSALPEGGTLSVSAHREGRQLVLQVADTGRGLTESAGTGTGLANLRARLRGMYGNAGTLTLSPNAPRGLKATLRIPATLSGTGGDHDAV
jgi:signal transduction histidine kinase